MWILFAFLSAFAGATRNVFSKKLLAAVDEYAVSWALWFFGLPILFATLFFLGLPKNITPTFWAVTAANVFLNVAASLLFMRSLKYSPLSLVSPILALTPVFVTIVAMATLKEIPSALGFAGIFLAVAGAYLLHVHHLRFGIWKPFIELFKNKGCRYGLLVAALWGITSTLDKVAIQNASPVFYLVGMCVGVSFCFAIILRKRNFRFDSISSSWASLFILGTVFALMLTFQMFAIQSAFVSYALSIKRIDSLLAVVYGYFFFKETNIRERLAGASLMFLSLILIAIA